jgi:cysteine-rich repeat protein
VANTCVEAPLCGNGRLDPGEACDDGNQVNGDGCTAGCVSCAARDGDAVFAWGREGRCYSRHDRPVGWHEASQACAAKGGHLAVLATPEELEAVGEALLTAKTSSLWMGLAEISIENEYRWVTLETSHQVPWSAGRPDGFGRVDGCAAMGREPAGVRVTDRPCTSTAAYVCETAPPFVHGAANRIYFRVVGTFTWDEASALCEGQGGRLAGFDTPDEGTLVARRFAAYHWLGARAAGPERAFTWISGRPFTAGDVGAGGEYQHFSRGARCLIAGRDGRWHARPCGDRFPALCERDTRVPGPTRPPADAPAGGSPDVQAAGDAR